MGTIHIKIKNKRRGGEYFKRRERISDFLFPFRNTYIGTNEMLRHLLEIKFVRKQISIKMTKLFLKYTNCTKCNKGLAQFFFYQGR